MQAGERYARLLDVARESSSEKRRELLHEVTDLFFDSSDTHSPMEANIFGELMAKVAFELDTEVRKELSSRFDRGDAPRALAVALANDQIDIAGPILRNSRALTQDDLIRVVETQGSAHQMVVTQRPDVGEALSDALVTHGNDKVVAALVNNQTAKVSADTFDRIVDRAENNKALHKPIIARKAISPEHLNRLYTIVDAPMRKEILERNKGFSEAEVERAMERARTRVAMINGTLPGDFEASRRTFEAQKAAKGVTPGHLPNWWRNGQKTLFLIGFGEFSGLDFHQCHDLFEKCDIDNLAMVCRASGFDRALFVTLAVLVLGNDGMGQATTLGHMYNDVPVEAAQRAMRFMRLRANVAAKAA